jgi:CHASE2 domain-containing sensor protein
MAVVGKLVVLKLDGDFEHQGFRVELEIGAEEQRPDVVMAGELPANPELSAYLTQWQQTYQSLGLGSRITPQTVVYDGLIHRCQKCGQLAKELGDRLNAWLDTQSFRSLEQTLRTRLKQDDPVRVLIRSENQTLHHLPWHCWNFMEHYPQAEIALSGRWSALMITEQAKGQVRGQAVRGKQTVRQKAQHSVRQIVRQIVQQTIACKNKIRILAILGNREGIDVDRDRQFLKSLPDADVLFLDEPTRETMNDSLWDQPWDILFFAGHGRTKGQTGLIEINPQESLTIAQLKHGLAQAIAKGLQLAIFNSCDGLGLAYDLKSLHLTQLIVMKEPVPDEVAQKFVRYFLQAFADGNSLYAATRQARQRLQGLESKFPCASWLPIIFCQNPGARPSTWRELLQKHREKPIWQSLVTGLLIGFLSAGLVVGGRSQGWLQPAELWAYDQFMKLQTHSISDPNLLIVGIDEEDINKFKKPLLDPILYQLLTKLEKYQPKVIGLDILRDSPESLNPSHKERDWQKLTRFLKTRNSLIALCGKESNSEVPVSPPPGVPMNRVGYADALANDPSKVIRRYILSYKDTDQTSCSTPFSFAFQMLSRVVPKQTILPGQTMQPLPTERQTIPLGDFQLKLLKYDSGGYRLSQEDAAGHQLLIDYRPTIIARMPSLTDILNGNDADLQPLVRDRIVLIGYVGNLSQDEHQTPSGKRSGVQIHAHVVSQILNAITNKKPLLAPWSKLTEMLWILGWAAIAGCIVWFVPKRLILIALGMIGTVLLGGSFGLFYQSIWVPLIPSSLTLLLTSSVTLVLRTPSQNSRT